MSNLTPRINRLEHNRLLNGDFAIWQRGTSLSAADNSYRADRWRVDNTQANTHSRQLGGPVGSKYFWRTTFAASGEMQMFQAFEDVEVETMKGKTFTFIFKLRRSSDFAGGMQIRLQQNATPNTSIGGGWSNITTLDIDNADIDTSDFTQYKVAFTVPVSGAEGVRVNFVTPSLQVVGAQLDIAQAMLLEGDFSGMTEDIPYFRQGKNFGEEIAMCQRFYEKSYSFETAPGTGVSEGSCGMSAINGTPYFNVQFRVEKRAIPTMNYWDWVGNASRIRTNGTNNIVLNGSLASATSGFSLIHNTSVSEVFAQWDADAEI